MLVLRYACQAYLILCEPEDASRSVPINEVNEEALHRKGGAWPPCLFQVLVTFQWHVGSK